MWLKYLIFSSDIRGSRRANPPSFGDATTFPHLPPTIGWIVDYLINCLSSTIVYSEQEIVISVPLTRIIIPDRCHMIRVGYHLKNYDTGTFKAILIPIEFFI